jgi:hypothetical protein
MKALVVLNALMALVVANPSDNYQGVSLGSLLAIDTLVEERTLPETDICSTKPKDSCLPEPIGAGPTPSPDTDAAFLSYATFASTASGATTPPGYTNTFTNLQASVNAYGYMGYTTIDTYDTALCATRCSGVDNCHGFNIFFERDPSVDPGTDCLNPPSTTEIKCTFWSGYVGTENALNDGQWRSDFHVVIAGSNGYMSTEPPAVDGFTVQALGNNAIVAPLDCNGKDTYMGSMTYTTNVFDPNLCAETCASTNEFDIAHPPAGSEPMICTFFVTYLQSNNGVPQGQYCAMYSQTWDLSFATNNVSYQDIFPPSSLEAQRC